MRTAVRGVQNRFAMHVVPRVAGLVAAIAIAAAAAAAPAAAERRPATIGMGVSGTAETSFYGGRALGIPVSIDAGAQVQGELWWHGSASFGASSASHLGDGAEIGEGHTFELRTGPHVLHCRGRYCAGASLELGWGHARWTLGAGDEERSLDDVHLEARLRGAVALSDSGKVLLEASVGPRVRWYLRAADAGGMDRPMPDTLRGGVAGLALIVRN